MSIGSPNAVNAINVRLFAEKLQRIDGTTVATESVRSISRLGILNTLQVIEHMSL